MRPKDLSPRSSVTFRTSERVNRVVLWINAAFAIDASAPGFLSATSDSLHAGFQSISDGQPLIIKMGPENGGTISIRTDSMELAGDVVQDLCRYLSLTQLDSVAEFPDEFATFAGVLAKVEDYNSARLKMSADIADSSNLVKMLVIKAEDARILGEAKLMEKYYSQLYDLNRELIGEYNKRANNHAELLAALKDVNAMIQKAYADTHTYIRMSPGSSCVPSLCDVLSFGG
jgi:Bardet-Biedl syndrome 2 protein